MTGTRYITGTITGATAGPAAGNGAPTWQVTIDAIEGAEGTVTMPTDDGALCTYTLEAGFRSAGLVTIAVEDGKILHFTSLVKGGAVARRDYLVTVEVATHDADLLERGIPEALRSRLAGTAARAVSISPVQGHGNGEEHYSAADFEAGDFGATDDDEHLLARKLAAQMNATDPIPGLD